jgi:transcriptional regulator with XRE-family HTH domain
MLISGLAFVNTNPEVEMSMGSEIAKARKRAELSQKQLAESTLKEDGTPISPQFLNDIERDRRRPGSYILNALAKKLNLDPDRLHWLAGQVPPDVVQGRADAKRLDEAVKSFRKAYRK